MTQLELRIALVGAKGDGVAEGRGIFVPLTLPGELARVEVQGERGEMVGLVEASPDRQDPPCPHFGDCGGCALQHWKTPPYLDWKIEQIRLALARERIETTFAEPYLAPPGSRRRMALHARRTGRTAELGFKARRSWRLVGIEVCPISDPRLVRALPALRALAEPMLEHPKSAPILHVTWTASGIDVDVSGVEARSGGLSADARLRAAQAAGEGDFARVTLGGEMIYQARSPVVMVGPARVVLPPGGFLQAVAGAETAMAACVLDHLAGARSAADLYCGVGAFAFRLAQTMRVSAFDSSAPAIAALKAGIASAPGLKPIAVETRDLVKRPVLAADLTRLEALVLDPPRAGALEQIGEIARSKLARVAYVSCNPATFARDARILIDAGFKLECVKPIDQFLWSAHVELVGLFSR
ncbi:MAG: methyltransferase [Caulobacteraceae bacterium]|nr:methyltransferase [Caulobacteraceae bacterium]